MTLAKKIKTRAPKHFDDDITLLQTLSDLMDENPHLPRPRVIFDRDYKDAVSNLISWYLYPSYDISVPDVDEDGKWIDNLDDRRARHATLQRVDLEERIAALILALGEDLEWEKNDPSVDKWSYQLRTTWHGTQLFITTSRDAVCEEVVVLETEREDEIPDPDFVATAPKVKVTVKDKITEWQCNERLAAVTAPKRTRTVEVLS